MSKPVEITTIAAARLWLEVAVPGSACCYHKGNLLRDRQVSRTGFPDARDAANEIADFMWEAHRQGKVTLHLKKLSERECAYLAIRKGEQQ